VPRLRLRLTRYPPFGGKELDRARDIGAIAATVEHEEIGEAVAVVVERVDPVPITDGCFRDRLSGEAAGGVAEGQRPQARANGPPPSQMEAFRARSRWHPAWNIRRDRHAGPGGNPAA